MNITSLNELLENIRDGKTTVEEAVQSLRKLPFEDLGFAHVDHHRPLRQGAPEVIFCQGKTPEHTAGIFQSLSSRNNTVFGTRATIEHFSAVKLKVPDAEWCEQARIIRVMRQHSNPDDDRYIAVLCAGTSDIPVAEEAAVTAETMGSTVKRAYDVGVAGLHRLLDKQDLLYKASALVVAAGMEGALPSVVGGLVSKPVIAVPTSIGYGASFDGLAALLAMLNCCASGVVVVNIDNGFGAGYFAHMILQGDSD